MDAMFLSSLLHHEYSMTQINKKKKKNEKKNKTNKRKKHYRKMTKVPQILLSLDNGRYSLVPVLKCLNKVQVSVQLPCGLKSLLLDWLPTNSREHRLPNYFSHRW